MAIPVPLQRNTVIEKTINATVYKIELLGAKDGKKLAAMITRVIAPALEAKDKLAKFCELATDAQLDYLCDTLAAKTRISPEATPEVELALKDVFDRHFSGHYGTMMLWLKACLEANYGDFLGELGIDSETLKSLLATLAAPETVTAMATAQTGQTAPSGGASLRASAG